MRPLLAALLLVPLAVGCRTNAPGESRVQENDGDSFAKRAWMDKAARTLLYGASKVDDDQADALAALPRDQIIDKLMADPRFGLTMLDFNLFFLGLKTPSLDQALSGFPIGSRAAFDAAIEAMNGGDYYKLFDWQRDRIYVQGGYNQPDGGAPCNTPNATQDAQRTCWLAQAKTALDAWIAKVQASTDVPTLCQAYNNLSNAADAYPAFVGKAGLPFPIEQMFNPGVSTQIHCGVLGVPMTGAPTIQQEIASEAQMHQQELAKLPTLIQAMPKHPAQTLADFVQVSAADYPSLRTNGQLESYDTGTWTKLTNSSTNFDRKRGAYALRTFFCDDLTPLNIVAPAQHASGKHATDPNCAACHYKLDPMAGFFRYRGIFGVDFANLDSLIYDDNLVRTGDDLTKYYANWKAPADSGRTWDVGYVRSPTDPTLNSYGDTVDDLFKIIRSAPEPKACLAKRLAEYTLGVNQVYDGKWLASLASDLVAAGEPTAASGASSVAVKKVMKSLVLSKTFSTPDPVQGQCYDFAPGAAQSNLPCQIAFVVQKNCFGCHKGSHPSGGLSLDQWVARDDGKQGFVQKDPATGAQVPRATTVASLLTVLSTNDPDKQMPLNQYMDPVERATLYKWVQNGASGGTP